MRGHIPLAWPRAESKYSFSLKPSNLSAATLSERRFQISAASINRLGSSAGCNRKRTCQEDDASSALLAEIRVLALWERIGLITMGSVGSSKRKHNFTGAAAVTAIGRRHSRICSARRASSCSLPSIEPSGERSACSQWSCRLSKRGLPFRCEGSGMARATAGPHRVRQSTTSSTNPVNVATAGLAGGRLASSDNARQACGMARASCSNRSASAPATTASQRARHAPSPLASPGSIFCRVTSAEAKRSAFAQNIQSPPTATPGATVFLSRVDASRSTSVGIFTRRTTTRHGASEIGALGSGVSAMIGVEASG